MLQLARMYLTVDDLDACQQQCVQLLKMDSENDDATVVSLDFLKKCFSYHPIVIHGFISVSVTIYAIVPIFSKKLTIVTANWP